MWVSSIALDKVYVAVTQTPKLQSYNKKVYYLLTVYTNFTSPTFQIITHQTLSDSLASQYVVSLVTTRGKTELEVHALTFKCFHLEMTHVTSIYTLMSGNSPLCHFSSRALGNDGSKGTEVIGKYFWLITPKYLWNGIGLRDSKFWSIHLENTLTLLVLCELQ